jgi:hypothetical protein
MKKRITVLKKGIEQKGGPESFCCWGPMIPFIV